MPSPSTGTLKEPSTVKFCPAVISVTGKPFCVTDMFRSLSNPVTSFAPARAAASSSSGTGSRLTLPEGLEALESVAAAGSSVWPSSNPL